MAPPPPLILGLRGPNKLLQQVFSSTLNRSMDLSIYLCIVGNR